MPLVDDGSWWKLAAVYIDVGSSRPIGYSLDGCCYLAGRRKDRNVVENSAPWGESATENEYIREKDNWQDEVRKV